MLRIRKLTPKECCRLMGFEDKDYEAMKKRFEQRYERYISSADVRVNASLSVPEVAENVKKEFLK